MIGFSENYTEDFENRCVISKKMNDASIVQTLLESLEARHGGQGSLFLASANWQ